MSSSPPRTPKKVEKLLHKALADIMRGRPADAGRYLEDALEASPDDVFVNQVWGLFKQGTGDLDEAEHYLRRAVEIAPDHAGALSTLADFLDYRRDDLTAAAFYWDKAVAAGGSSHNRFGYGRFLVVRLHDPFGAKEHLVAAATAEPGSSIYWGHAAGVLLATGDTQRGWALLDGTANLAWTDAIELECNFYVFAHDPEDATRAEALGDVKRLLLAGTRVQRWDFAANVAQARIDSHPQVEMLAKLAVVAIDLAPIEDLDAFPVWVKCEPSPTPESEEPVPEHAAVDRWMPLLDARGQPWSGPPDIPGL